MIVSTDALTTINTMPITTARVVACPTAIALVPHAMPCWHPDKRDQRAEHDAHQQAREQIAERHRADRLLHVLHETRVDHCQPDDRAADDAHQARVHRQRRNHQHEREHARRDEEVDRVDAERGQRVDLLVDFHRADFGRVRGTGAARHDDGRHDRRHLADHRHGDEVRGVDAGAERAQLRDADEREDHADQHADEADDRQRVGARFFDVLDHVGLQVFRAARREAAHRQRRLADERDEIDHTAPQLLRAFADLLHERCGVLRARGAFAGFDGECERDQPARAVRQTAVVEGNGLRLRGPIDVDQAGDQAAVPTAQCGCIESNGARTRCLGEPSPDIVDRRQRFFHQPIAAQRQAHGAVGLVDSQRRGAWGRCRTVNLCHGGRFASDSLCLDPIVRHLRVVGTEVGEVVVRARLDELTPRDGAIARPVRAQFRHRFDRPRRERGSKNTEC